MFHTCEVCTIWPEAGIVKGLFWNTSLLKPQPSPHSHYTLFPWKVHNLDKVFGELSNKEQKALF